MGALIGREIIQSRIWDDPKAPPQPNLNYKETFPISVFAAIRKEMNDEKSITLDKVIDQMQKDLENKQPIFPARPANYLMTFAGYPGQVGAIQISKEIPWEPEQRRHDRIPTEKAVGDLLYSLGLVNEKGEIDPQGGTRVRWSDIVGRPTIFTEMGQSDAGVITQKAITDAFTSLSSRFGTYETETDSHLSILDRRVGEHIINYDNPHQITLSQLGGVTLEMLKFHTDDLNNPHHVTKLQLGLENVNNTSDADKPISTAQQEALDSIQALLNEINLALDDQNYITGASYDQASGNLTLKLRNGSTIVLFIPINGLVYDAHYEGSTKEFVITKLSGAEKKVSLSDLFIRYVGSPGAAVNIEIDGDQITGEQIIRATLNPGAISGSLLIEGTVEERFLADQSVSTRTLADLNVTTEKLADRSVTTIKIDELAITTSRLANRSVTGEKLFSSSVPQRVLVVHDAERDPIWSRITSEMIHDSVLQTRHYENNSITGSKIISKEISSTHIADRSLLNEHYAQLSITNDKIANGTIVGLKFADSIQLPGTPRITVRPLDDSDTNQIPDTRWVRDRITASEMKNENLSDRIVDGRVLFSTPNPNRVLAVYAADADPTWGLINANMMDSESVLTRNIKDLNVTRAKIADNAIIERHVNGQAIQERHLADDAVTSQKIWKSERANRVLGVTKDGTNPDYLQINRQMLLDNLISTQQIEDRTVTRSKLETSSASNRVLVVGAGNTDPVWGQVRNQMLADKSVDARVFMSSPFANRVLVVTPESDGDAVWNQIISEMIRDREIKNNNIGLKEIRSEHLADKIIASNHIKDWTIKNNNIAPRAIGATELFTSPEPNRVLAVTTMPYSDPQWLQVTREMIVDKAINQDKLFRSDHPYRVLGATNAGDPPEYLMLDTNFFVDYSITSTKLAPDLFFHGHPTLTLHPSKEAGIEKELHHIPSTWWVRQCVADMINNFNPEILFDTVSSEMIQPRAIDGTKLFTHPHAPRVLGITHPGEDVEFILVEEDLIANGAVTRDKLVPNITLLGTPSIEVRPSPNASDSGGGGRLVPDCQWVLDAIGNYSGTIGTGPGTGTGEVLLPGSVGTAEIMGRAVTGEKLFSSPFPNRLLGVYGANSDPQYLQANNQMIQDRAIDGRTLMTSSLANRVLAVDVSNHDPIWMQINWEMMGALSVGKEQLRENSVGTNNLIKESVTKAKLANEPMIDTIHLLDTVVTNRKIANEAVSNEKLTDSTIRGEKLVDDIILPGNPTVPAHNNYEKRSIRNTIISSKPPTPDKGEDGDIWFRYY